MPDWSDRPALAPRHEVSATVSMAASAVHATPRPRVIAQGPDWGVFEYVCTLGPQDRPIEERHESFSMSAVVAGRFNYHGDRGREQLYPGAWLLGNNGTCFQCGHDHSQGDRCIAFHLAPAYFEQIATRVAGSSRFRFRRGMLPPLQVLAALSARIEAGVALRDSLQAEETLVQLAEQVITALADAPAAAGEDSPVSARDARRLGEVAEHMALHAHTSLPLDLLAAQAAMSKYHFLRSFRKAFQVTPHQYLMGQRMQRAARRLLQSRDPIAAIAFDAGFGDLSTFNSHFRRRFGQTPRAFRMRG